MSDGTLEQFRSQYQQIAQRLDAAKSSEQRDAVKKEIIGLFKTVDQAITDLSALKEEIRVLVDKYKQLAAALWKTALGMNPENEQAKENLQNIGAAK